MPDRARARRAGARGRGLDGPAARQPLPLSPRRRRPRRLQRRQGHPRAAEHRHPRGPAGPHPRRHAQREPEPGHRPRGQDVEGGDRRPRHRAGAVPRRGRGGGDGAVPRGLARASSTGSRDIPGLRAVVEQDPVNRVLPHAVIYFEPSGRGRRAARCSSRSRRASPTSTCSRAPHQGGYADEIAIDPINLQPGDEAIIVSAAARGARRGADDRPRGRRRLNAATPGRGKFSPRPASMPPCPGRTRTPEATQAAPSPRGGLVTERRRSR